MPTTPLNTWQENWKQGAQEFSAEFNKARDGRSYADIERATGLSSTIVGKVVNCTFTSRPPDVNTVIYLALFAGLDPAASVRRMYRPDYSEQITRLQDLMRLRA